MTILLSILGTFTVLLLAGLTLSYFWTRKLARLGEFLAPQAGQIQPVTDGSIHYIEAGNPKKQTLVLIHGLSGQLQHFTYGLVKRLSQDHHVIALDRPGCGYSTRDSDALASLPEQARMIAEFLTMKQVKDPVLVGHSLGGAVALAIALDNPRWIAGLALLAPLTHPLRGAPDVFKPLQIRSPLVRRALANTIAVPMAQRTASAALTAVFAPEPCPEDFLDRAGGALGLRPKAFVAASADAVGADSSIEHQSTRYHELRTPGAILFGTDDAILPVAEQGLSMEQYGLPCEKLDGLGHMLPITALDDCEGFIRGVSVSTRLPASLSL
jgi:pimeloyl-ACP methyl ester carboxylesterase